MLPCDTEQRPPRDRNSAHRLDRESISRTYELIRPHIRRTPVIEVDPADFGFRAAGLVLKLELLQHTGSFKTRGAFTNLLTRDVPPAGVVAASGGNHGAAVAFTAMKLGKPATIFVPTVSSPAKIDRIRGYGAHLVVTGDRYDDALAASREWAAKSGALPVHAYDQIETLLGQGTVGLEFEEQAPGLDTLLVAVGGGGLIGGIAGVVRRTRPHRRRRAGSRPDPRARHGGGPPGRCAGRRDRRRFAGAQARRRVDVSVRAVVCRARGARARPGDRRRPAALWSTLRVMAEPGGAAALAALLSGAYVPGPGERVGVLVCGGNTAPPVTELRALACSYLQSGGNMFCTNCGVELKDDDAILLPLRRANRRRTHGGPGNDFDARQAE